MKKRKALEQILATKNDDYLATAQDGAKERDGMQRRSGETEHVAANAEVDHAVFGQFEQVVVDFKEPRPWRHNEDREARPAEITVDIHTLKQIQGQVGGFQKVAVARR